jgi:hypothetical protein
MNKLTSQDSMRDETTHVLQDKNSRLETIPTLSWPLTGRSMSADFLGSTKGG